MESPRVLPPLTPASQTAVILDAWDRAGICADDLDYIETHGTGTILGDPIEFQGLCHAFEKQTNRKQFCALSSSKTNIGHLYECAGIAAFIKAVAALTHQKIPGMCHLRFPIKKLISVILRFISILFRGNGLRKTIMSEPVVYPLLV